MPSIEFLNWGVMMIPERGCKDFGGFMSSLCAENKVGFFRGSWRCLRWHILLELQTQAACTKKCL